VLEYAISSFVICLFVGGGSWIYALYDVRKSQRRHEEFMRKIEHVQKMRAAPAE
jgi:hypothetical protein